MPGAKGPRSLVIVGDGEFGEIAYEYFTHDSPYDVVAFSVEREFRTKDELFGLPVADFETLEERYEPRSHCVFVAVTFTQLNRVRTRLLAEARGKGFSPSSYVSSRAFVWPNADIGENCFLFEHSVVQHHATIGDNVVVWSGTNVLHRATVGANTFVSANAVVNGFSAVGRSCFLGANSCVRDYVSIADDCIVGAGAVVIEDTKPGKVYVGNPARALEKSSYETRILPAGRP
jgi:sugar O-acyltransferase (sialic acid O-acetyltransferase NeuD family)